MNIDELYNYYNSLPPNQQGIFLDSLSESQRSEVERRIAWEIGLAPAILTVGGIAVIGVGILLYLILRK